MVIAANFEKKYETLISIDLEEDIRKDNLKIIINTYGYLLDGYEPSKHIGQTNTYLFLYKDAQIQDYRNTKINKYSDYYIYAKYGNKYAKMKYTNSLVMGNNETSIKIFIKNRFQAIRKSSSASITYDLPIVPIFEIRISPFLGLYFSEYLSLSSEDKYLTSIKSK